MLKAIQIQSLKDISCSSSVKFYSYIFSGELASVSHPPHCFFITITMKLMDTRERRKKKLTDRLRYYKVVV